MTSTPVDALPRVPLALLPTPLVAAPRLSDRVGTEVWFKRDDLTGLGLGGNKVRALEFLLGAGLRDGADVLVTGAGPQSNWAFLAALAARRCGLDAELCFYGDPPPRVRGNLALQELTGARLHWTGSKDRSSVDGMIAAVAERLAAEGRRPLVLPRGGATGLGSVGYLVAAAELDAQLGGAAGGVEVWLATGSCGTQAGLVAGRAAGGVVGVSVSRPVPECRARVLDLATTAARIAGCAGPDPAAVTVLDGWIGDGYGVTSAAGREAAALVAETEGVLLDPVFGAKAFAALLDAARSGRLERPVVFLVSGGAPTLFVSDLGTGAGL